VEGPLSHSKKVVFGSIWKSPTPSKVVVFSWKLLHGRIPTKDNLARRNYVSLAVNLNCVFCGGKTKTANHLFLYCQIVFKVWNMIMNWLEISMITP